jgi:hypothetical protein
VSGYSALPREDVRIGNQHNLVFPIVQTNTGWNSVLHVTNFDSKSNCGVTVTLYQSPSGSSDPSFGQFTRLLNRGETWHIDLANRGCRQAGSARPGSRPTATWRRRSTA